LETDIFPWNLFKRLKIYQSYQQKNPIFQQDTCGMGWQCRKEVCIAVILLKKNKQQTKPTHKTKHRRKQNKSKTGGKLPENL